MLRPDGVTRGVTASSLWLLGVSKSVLGSGVPEVRRAVEHTLTISRIRKYILTLCFFLESNCLLLYFIYKDCGLTDEDIDKC